LQECCSGLPPGLQCRLALLFIGFSGAMARIERWISAPKALGTERPEHLDLSALTTPSLAISCAAREALHQADVVETMLRGILPVLRKRYRLLSAAQARRQVDASTPRSSCT
jgi:phosphate:Na+ symporter